MQSKVDKSLLKKGISPKMKDIKKYDLYQLLLGKRRITQWAVTNYSWECL